MLRRFIKGALKDFFFAHEKWFLFPNPASAEDHAWKNAIGGPWLWSVLQLGQNRIPPPLRQHISEEASVHRIVWHSPLLFHDLGRDASHLGQILRKEQLQSHQAVVGRYFDMAVP
jgi:hypothetical protein